MRLHDKPFAANDEDTEAGSSELSAKDLKKLRSKERRREKKAQENKKGEIHVVSSVGSTLFITDVIMKEITLLQNIVKQKTLNEIFQWLDTVFSKLPIAVSLGIILFIYLFFIYLALLCQKQVTNIKWEKKKEMAEEAQ